MEDNYGCFVTNMLIPSHTNSLFRVTMKNGCFCVYLRLAFIYLFSNDAISGLLAYRLYSSNYIIITSCGYVVLYVSSNLEFNYQRPHLVYIDFNTNST